MSITIRQEQPADFDVIAQLTEAAFKNENHSVRTEQFIVNALRRSGQLTLSLVAVEEGSILGHVAISSVTISSGASRWYGLGPISVWPQRQRQGIGSKLVNAALADLRQQGAKGCVVLGDPAYYGRFGFNAHPNLVLPGVPPQYFQALAFEGDVPVGEVRYHESFEATA